MNIYNLAISKKTKSLLLTYGFLLHLLLLSSFFFLLSSFFFLPSAAQRGLNDPYTGGLTSYGLLLLVTSVLQQRERGVNAKAHLGVCVFLRYNMTEYFTNIKFHIINIIMFL